MKIPAVALLVFALPVAALAALEQKSPPVAPADADRPLLVWDVDPSLRQGLPRNFRTSSDHPKAAAPADMAGLAGLHESGSAEFTAATLKHMLAKLPPGQVTVFDLRQEDHGFVNGEPVSWYATNNWANVGRSHDAILADEAARVQAFTPGQEVTFSSDQAKKGGNTFLPEQVTVKHAATEAEVVAAAGARYVRITVSDHARPSDEEVDRFILAVRSLPSGAWVHFHCRAGKGRTTTFMALYDMLRNADSVSLLDIVHRQSLLIGDYDLLATADDSAKMAVAADRAALVRAFYDYARANPGGRPQLWTEWQAGQK